MPSLPMHFCNKAGCNKLTRNRFCEEHAAKERKEYDDTRATPAERGYDSQWKKFRKIYVAAHPLCAMCEARGKLTRTEIVHHIVPLEENGSKYDEDNLISICFNCHEKIHGKNRFKRKV